MAMASARPTGPSVLKWRSTKVRNRARAGVAYRQPAALRRRRLAPSMPSSGMRRATRVGPTRSPQGREVGGDARVPRRPAARFPVAAHQDAQRVVVHRARRRRTFQPRVEPLGERPRTRRIARTGNTARRFLTNSNPFRGWRCFPGRTRPRLFLGCRARGATACSRFRRRPSSTSACLDPSCGSSAPTARTHAPAPPANGPNAPARTSAAGSPAGTACVSSASWNSSSPRKTCPPWRGNSSLCSKRTMYRVLAEQASVRERRRQAGPCAARQAAARGPAAQPGVVVGHHAAAGTGQVEVLPPLRGSGPLQPLRRRLDGGRARDRRAGLPPRRGDVREAGRASSRRHAALRPRQPE